MPAEQGRMTHDFTQGGVFKQLVSFAFPLFLANLLQIVYNMVDVAIVGNVLGETGLSGVAIGGDITSFLTFVAVGFSEAGQIIVSQNIGAGHREEAKRLFTNMCSLLFWLAVAVTLFGTIFCKQLLHVMNTPAEAWAQARAYTVTCVLGTVFVYGYNAIGAFLRGIGNSKGPLFFIGVSTIINVILDILFVAGFHMEAFGAALATVISQLFSFLLGILYLIRNRKSLPFEIRLGDFRFDGKYLKVIVKLGIPMVLRHTAVQASMLFVSSWINSYGVIVSAVAGIGKKLNTVAALSANNLHTAGATMIGQNIGAKQYKRVPKIMGYAFLIAFSFAVVFSGLMFIIPEKIFGLMTNDYDAIASVAMQFVPVSYLIFLGVAVRAPMNSIINGGGNYKINLLVALLDGVVLRVGLSVFLGLACHMGYMGFWYGDALAGFTPLAIGGIYYLSGAWKNSKNLVKQGEA